MADLNAGSVTLEVRAVSTKLAADMAAAKAKLATSAAGIEKSLNLGDALRGMNGMSAMLPGVGGQFASVASNVAGMGASLGAVGIAASAAAAAIVAVTVAAGALGKAAVEAAASRQDLLLSFEILLKSKDAAAELVGQMQRLADTTPLETAGIAEASRLLLAMRFDVKDIVPMVTKMGDAMVVSGKGQEGLMRLALVLGQIKSAGRLLGQDVLQLNQLGLNPRAAIAQDMGISENEVRKRMEAGAIPAAQAIKSIFKDIEQNAGGAMSKLATGWNGRMSTLRDGWNRLLVTIGTPLVDALSPMLVSAANWLTKLSNGIQANMPAIVEYFNKIKEAMAPYAEAFRVMFDGVSRLAVAMAPITGIFLKLVEWAGLLAVKLLSLVQLGRALVIRGLLEYWTAVLTAINKVGEALGKILNAGKDKSGFPLLEILTNVAIVTVEGMMVVADKYRNIANEVMSQAKEQAIAQATAVIDGLKKQFDAHQEYVNKVKAIYDKYVSSSAAVRSRMTGATVENVGKAKSPDFEGMRSGIERGLVVQQLGERFVSQYEQATQTGGSTLGKEDDARSMIRELKIMNQSLFKLLWQQETTRQQAVLS